VAKPARKLKLEPVATVPIKLDLGCGPHPREGFEGVDQTNFPGVKHVYDLKETPWPWSDNSVSEAHASHFVEHLTAMERVAFWNELYRVLVPRGTCQIIVPHWASNRAYGDPTHQWPPVSEMAFYYISKEWRMQNAPHTDEKYLKGGFNCDFEATWGYAMRADLSVRNQEYQQFAMQNYKEVITDLIATVTKRVNA
jgi:hypothetical protein